MGDERRLDGNSLGGLLFELFDREMTFQRGCCDSCGSVNALGAVHVYRDAPGDVMRCPVCESVLVVIVPHGEVYRVSFSSLRWLEVSP